MEPKLKNQVYSMLFEMILEDYAANLENYSKPLHTLSLPHNDITASGKVALSDVDIEDFWDWLVTEKKFYLLCETLNANSTPHEQLENVNLYKMIKIFWFLNRNDVVRQMRAIKQILACAIHEHCATKYREIFTSDIFHRRSVLWDFASDHAELCEFMHDLATWAVGQRWPTICPLLGANIFYQIFVELNVPFECRSHSKNFEVVTTTRSIANLRKCNNKHVISMLDFFKRFYSNNTYNSLRKDIDPISFLKFAHTSGDYTLLDEVF